MIKKEHKESNDLEGEGEEEGGEEEKQKGEENICCSYRGPEFGPQNFPIRKLTTACNSTSRGSGALFRLPEALHECAQAHTKTHRQTLLNTSL